MLSDAVAAVLYQESTSQALAAKTEVERTAELDTEQDEEEHEMAQHDAMEVDVAHEISTDDEALDDFSVQDFEDMVMKASSRGIQLSKSVVNQRFGNLEMLDENEVKQGVQQGGVVRDYGEVYQSFGDAKLGSRNTVHHGIW